MTDVAYRFRPNLDALLTRDENASALKSVAASPAFSQMAKAITATPDFAARVERVRKILNRAGASSVNVQELTKRMFCAALLYGVLEADAERKNTLHEIREPLDQVIQNLSRDENLSQVLAALGAPAHTPTADARAAHDAASAAARAQLAIALDVLKKVRNGAPEPPKLERGRPAKQRLDAVIDVLVQEWERVTETAFTQSWHTDEHGRRVPNSLGAQFVYEIIGFIDEKRLPDVPGATERIVTERHRTSGK
jgi:hypothetical protein